MKKNISINISGIIFHIEEDGYEELKNYLDGITNYFSSFKDSNEIISDIENRIAEIFLSKLNDEKQVITGEDVEKLIATMGKVEDFQAVEDELDDEQASASSQQSGAGEKRERRNRKQSAGNQQRDLKRDEIRKMLGGVCSGIAAYFSVDPLWIRLLTILITIATSGIGILVYIILWILLPASYEPVENNYKKMYRNPQGKVLAGVAKGVSTYFGIDVAVTRVLFVIFAFIGGSGIIAYIILWVILPEASSITDKVQMEGEPVTLSNIESNIKKSLNVGEGEENVLVKILLFPFRLIAKIINGLGKALGPIFNFFVDFIRVAFGAFMIVIGTIFGLSALTAITVTTGLTNTNFLEEISKGNYNEIPQPVWLFIDSIPDITFLGALFITIIPSLFIILLGVSVIAKKIAFNSTVGWTMFGLFVAGLFIIGTNVPGLIYSYHEEARYEEERNFPINSSTIYFDVDEMKGFSDYHEVDIWFKGHEGNDLIAEIEVKSQGSSRKTALENAKKVKYDIIQKDSLFLFDYGMSIEKEDGFYFQEIDIILDLPYNKPFIMDRSMRRLLSYRAIDRYGYRMNQVDDENRWIFTETGLECLTCDKFNSGYYNRQSDQLSRLFQLDDFSSIEVRSPISVEIRQGEQQKVEFRAREKDLDILDLIVVDGNLEVSFNSSLSSAKNFDLQSDDIKLYITVPDIDRIELNQASNCVLKPMELSALEIDLSGASKAEIDVDAKEIKVSLNGASELELKGDGNLVTANLNGGSEMDAYRFTSSSAVISCYGGSKAKLYATDQIQISRDIASSVKYRGGATETPGKEN